MKFSCDKNILLNACNISSKAASSKSPIPALEGLLLETIDNTLKITGYNLKEGIFTSIDCDVEEGGRTVLNTKIFTEILRRMQDGIITVSTDASLKTNITCGKSEFNIMAIDAEDYPELPEVDNNEVFSVPSSVLKSMINQTSFAIATSELRPVYTGELFEIENSVLTVVAVDGYRLAIRTEALNTTVENCSFIVPGYALSDIERICEDDDKLVTVYMDATHIIFKIENTVVITRRLEGDFLNYKNSIPKMNKYDIVVNKSELLATLNRVSIVIKEKDSSPIKMVFGENHILCNCVTPVGKAEDVCFCEGSAENMNIGFNDKYITDAIKNANCEKIVLRMSSPSSPCIIQAAGGESKFTYMILPVRLRN